MGASYRFTAELWEWGGRASWFFVTLPADVTADIRERPRAPRAFGSISVRARIGSSMFDTSIFPSDDSLLLPVRRAVRMREAIEPGSRVDVDLEIMDGFS